MQNSDRTFSGLIAVFYLTIFLAGCAPVSLPVQESQQTPNFFIPATPQVHTASPTINPSGSGNTAGNQPAQTLKCTDRLTFIRDLTITDGTVLTPDSTLDKRWEVENSGDCNWDKDYRIRLIAGPGLGAKEVQALYPARSGTRAVVRLVFKAPLEPGTYRSAWQAYNPAGEPFGDPFFIDFVVQ